MTPDELGCPRCKGKLTPHCPSSDGCWWQRCRTCHVVYDLPSMRGFDTKTGEPFKVAPPKQGGGDTNTGATS